MNCFQNNKVSLNNNFSILSNKADNNSSALFFYIPIAIKNTEALVLGVKIAYCIVDKPDLEYHETEKDSSLKLVSSIDDIE